MAKKLSRSFLIAIATSATAIIACRHDRFGINDADDSREHLTIEQARTFFETQCGGLLLTKSQRGHTHGDDNRVYGIDPGDFAPVWSQAVTGSSPHVDAVDVTITPAWHYEAVFHEINRRGDVVRRTVEVAQKLVVTQWHGHNRWEGKYAYVATLIPTPDYYATHKNYRSKYSSAVQGSDFTGIVYYHSLDGRFVHADRLDRGTLVKRVYAGDLSDAEVSEELEAMVGKAGLVGMGGSYSVNSAIIDANPVIVTSCAICHQMKPGCACDDFYQQNCWKCFNPLPCPCSSFTFLCTICYRAQSECPGHPTDPDPGTDPNNGTRCPKCFSKPCICINPPVNPGTPTNPTPPTGKQWKRDTSKTNCPDGYNTNTLRADATFGSLKGAEYNAWMLKAFTDARENEHSLSLIRNNRGELEWHSRTGDKSWVRIVTADETSGATTIAHIHNHVGPDALPPSPLDIYTFANQMNDNGKRTPMEMYVALTGGEVYCLRIENTQQAKTFAGLLDKQGTDNYINTNNKFPPGSVISHAFNAMEAQLKEYNKNCNANDKLSPRDIYAYSMAYGLQQSNSGIRLMKMDKQGTFEQLGIDKTSDTHPITRQEVVKLTFKNCR